MKKHLTALFVLLFVLIFAVGCGGSSNTSTSDTSSDTSASKTVEKDASDAGKDFSSFITSVKDKVSSMSASDAADVDKEVDDLIASFKGTSSSDETLVGTWEATSAELADGKKADITLSLQQDGTYKEECFDLDDEGNVIDTTKPSEVYTGKWVTDQDHLGLIATETTKGGETKTGANKVDASDLATTYTYTLSDDNLNLTNEETHAIYEFVKM